MAVRSSNVNVRIEPDIKEQAAAILKVLGISESTYVDMAYRQLVLQKGIPFPVSLPGSIRTRDTMSDADFNAMMATGLKQAQAGDAMPLDAAFDDILARI